jgi:cytidylate kinase
MGLITVSGQPGCRFEEVARLTAQRLQFQLVTAARLASMTEQEFGVATKVPDRAYPDVAASVLARLATQHHLVFCAEGAEVLFRSFPSVLRVHVVAPEGVKIGNLMLDLRLERPAARQSLRDLEKEHKLTLTRRTGKATIPLHSTDLVLNAENLNPEQMAVLIETAARAQGMLEQGHLPAGAEAQIQFQVRLRLARHGIVPPGKVSLSGAAFAHPSEQIFANLLDFYRIPWEYEPRSFPIQWDRNGKVLEAFTPDFYLPEFDMYLELTTMKQSLVTKKNRKVKLVRELYPDLNIQVFYQKDFENLVFKYGLTERLAAV